MIVNATAGCLNAFMRLRMRTNKPSSKQWTIPLLRDLHCNVARCHPSPCLDFQGMTQAANNVVLVSRSYVVASVVAVRGHRGAEPGVNSLGQSGRKAWWAAKGYSLSPVRLRLGLG